jgi:Tfp pilus assembly protein PilF
MTSPPVRTPIVRSAAAVSTAVAVALVLGACSSSGKPGATDSATAADAEDTARILARGLQEQLAGKLDDAENDFRAVISRDPKNTPAFFDLGVIYQTEQKNSDAEDQYRLALTIDPKFERALYNLAILRARAGDGTGAIALYREAIVANPRDANAHYNLGLLLRGAGKTEEGNQEVRTGVNLDPTLRPKAIARGVPLTGS